MENFRYHACDPSMFRRFRGLIVRGLQPSDDQAGGPGTNEPELCTRHFRARLLSSVELATIGLSWVPVVAEEVLKARSKICHLVEALETSSRTRVELRWWSISIE